MIKTVRSSLIRVSEENRIFLESIKNAARYKSVDCAITKLRIDSLTKRRKINLMNSKDFGL